MTKRLDEAKKYVESYKESMDKHDTDGSIIYGLRAMNMLTVIEDTAIDGEAKEVESLANEMISAFDKNIDLSEYGRKRFFYYS